MDEEEIPPDHYANWFALFHLCQNIGSQKAIHMSSVEFAKIINLSQQTASRRLNQLEEIDWIKRKTIGKGQRIKITKKGADVMLTMYKNLKQILEEILIVGEVTEGMGEGGYYVRIQEYYIQFKEKLGFKPWYGTLNLQFNDLNKELLEESLNNQIPVRIEGFEKENGEYGKRTYGSVDCYKCIISCLDNQEKKINAAILRIKRTHHKKNIIEIIAEPYLREILKLKDGDRIRIEFSKK
ncbi:MAG: CTP-dependent riboflavin kinase [Candidatus Lokiarchaeota archaeon]|nr:CTP-dependent riboflavin kinase [Candidatus Lokiarchaeota archaeon]